MSDFLTSLNTQVDVDALTHLPRAVKNLETLYNAISQRYCLPEEMNLGGDYFEWLCRTHFGDVSMDYFLNDMTKDELNFRVSAFNFNMIDNHDLCMFDAQELALEKLSDLCKQLQLRL